MAMSSIYRLLESFWQFPEVMASADPTSRRSSVQKHFQQIIQEALALQRGAQRVAADLKQAAVARGDHFGLDDIERDAGARFHQIGGDAVDQAQAIHHEFEGQVGHAEALLGLHEIAMAVGGQVGARVLVAHLADDAGVAGELAVGAGADAEVVAEGPVVEVVAAALAGLGEGRGFVVLVAGLGEHRFNELLHVGGEVVIRQFGRRAAVEGRVGFQREVVAGQVLRRERHGGLQIGCKACAVFCLGKAYIRSRLMLSKCRCAMAIARFASSALWMRPSALRCASLKLWMPSDSRFTPASR